MSLASKREIMRSYDRLPSEAREIISSSPVAIDPVTVERDIAAQGFRTWRSRIIPLLAQFTRMRTVQTYGADHPNAAE